MQSLHKFKNIITTVYNKNYKHLEIKYISSFVKETLANDTPKPLGRWNIDYCTNQINRKIDFANEDHCSPCGKYNIHRYNHNGYYQYNMSLDELEILYGASVIEARS
jgi:hypothetical protein